MQELVSIIVPVYNVENFVGHCINSLISQTYNDIEIILVNDGSKDNSGAICEEFKLKDDRIVVLHKENGGLSSARNYGIDHAKGELLAFIDSDDWVEPQFVESLRNALLHDHSQIACCGFKIINEQDKIVKVQKRDIPVVLNSKEALESTLLDGDVKNVAWNKLYKKELFENVRYPEGKNYEDVATTYKLILKSEKISIVNECLNYYFLREDSIIHTLSLKNFENWIFAYSTRKEDIAGIVDKNIETVGDIIFYYNIVKNAKRNNDEKVRELYLCNRKIFRKLLSLKNICLLFKNVKSFSLILKIFFVAMF